jgi:hypothetical protein
MDPYMILAVFIAFIIGHSVELIRRELTFSPIYDSKKTIIGYINNAHKSTWILKTLESENTKPILDMNNQIVGYMFNNPALEQHLSKIPVET